jgi:carboxyl-terminal processing protease
MKHKQQDSNYKGHATRFTVNNKFRHKFILNGHNDISFLSQRMTSNTEYAIMPEGQKREATLMPVKVKYSLIAFLAVLVIPLSFTLGCISQGITGPSDNTGISLVDQAWNAIHQNYVDPSKLDSTSLSRGAIKGIMSALNDPYSAYLDPETYQMFQSDIEGNFQGIGAEVTLNTDNRVTIVAPLPNSPAARAGLKTGDVIMAVNGKSTEGLSATEVALVVRGPAGTTVTLTILHAGETIPENIEITRAQINEASVSSELKDGNAYIRIFQFGTNTNSEFNNALQTFDLKNTTGIILDLRSNPGGLVPTVVDVASHFLKQGVVLTLVDNKGKQTADSVHPNGVYTDLPMVVLVDQYSASGSEVLTGALRDYKRATIAGVKTFGKGSYDVNIPLQDGSYIYLTVGRWLTPNGQLIEGKGIEPDYVLKETGDAEIQWAVDFLKKPK